MAQQIVNLGTLADGSDGDTNKVAWGKAKDNFAELYAYAGAIVGSNLLINGAGQVNQRGYSSGSATTVANQYTVDRWKVQTSGQNLSWTTSGGIATFTAPAGGVAQVVEGASIIGGSYVLCWTGTATATVAGTAVTSGTPFTLTANTNATVVFSSGTFSLPKLERGVAATPFDFRHPQQELALCQRYFEKSYDAGVAPGTVTSIGAERINIAGLASSARGVNIPSTYKISKLAVPTVAIYSPNSGAAGKCYDAALSVDSNAIIDPALVGTRSHTIASTLGASTTLDVRVHWTATAEL